MKKGDIVVIIIVFILSLSSMTMLGINKRSLDKKYIVIQIDKKIVKKISIDNSTKGIYDFKLDANQVGYIEIKDGRVRMLEMDNQICPQKICSLTGWIEKKYETIVCLPNKISINIDEINDNTQEVDEFSF